MSQHTVKYHDTSALVGLRWARLPRNLSDRTLGVRWGDVFAPMAQSDLIGTPSLLSLIMGGASEKFKSQTLLIAYAKNEDGVYFGALTSGGKPVLEPEHLFETQDALLVWVGQEITQEGGVQGLLLSASIEADINTKFPVETIIPPHEGFEVSVLTGRAPKIDLNKVLADASVVQAVMVASLVACIAVAGYFVLTGGFSKQTTQTEAPQLPLFVSRIEAAFLHNCASAFGKPWNIGPGWTLMSEGCTAPGMTSLSSEPVLAPIAYQLFSLRTGYDVAIARAAAELVLGDSDIELTINTNRLIMTRAIDAPVRREAVQVARPTGAMHRILEGLYLGKARSVNPSGEDTKITLWGAFSEAVAPLNSLPWAEVRSISRKEGLVTLIVGQKHGVATIGNGV